MNKDQIKGAAKRGLGKVQEAVGKVSGNKTQEGKGLIKQGKGAVQQKVGNAKETLRDQNK
jgi:uncharacterized protein YjbJ (UPF0337 family)